MWAQASSQHIARQSRQHGYKGAIEDAIEDPHPRDRHDSKSGKPLDFLAEDQKEE
jgi:hypothetical protein